MMLPMEARKLSNLGVPAGSGHICEQWVIKDLTGIEPVTSSMLLRPEILGLELGLAATLGKRWPWKRDMACYRQFSRRTRQALQGSSAAELRPERIPSGAHSTIC